VVLAFTFMLSFILYAKHSKVEAILVPCARALKQASKLAEGGRTNAKVLLQSAGRGLATAENTSTSEKLCVLLYCVTVHVPVTSSRSHDLATTTTTLTKLKNGLIIHHTLSVRFSDPPLYIKSPLDPQRYRSFERARQSKSPLSANRNRGFQSSSSLLQG
jgi:hypothetical protein